MAVRCLVVVVLLALACGSVPEGVGKPQSGAAEAAVDPTMFSGARAYAHLEALASIGPRVTGTPGADKARRYLEDRLVEFGYRVERVTLSTPSGEVTQLVGLLPGDSTDRFVLAAAFDTRRIPGIEFVGANASASGPAVVLELARASSERPRAYTLMVLLIEGDALPADGSLVGFAGSKALAEHLADNGDFERIRLAIFLQQIGDIDLSISRDLRSHHVYREFFWEAAAVLGRSAYFETNARVESIAGSHVEFIEHGLPRSVLISDPRFGGSEIPGRHAASADDTARRCAPDSLAVVGEVTLEALDRIATRLSRIDRFYESPLAGPRPQGASDSQGGGGARGPAE